MPHSTWHTIAVRDDPALRSFLERHEPVAVVLSDKLRAGKLDRRLRSGGRFYFLPGHAAVFHGPGGFFYPVGLADTRNTDEVRELKRSLGTFLRLHSIMGTARDVAAFEQLTRSRATKVIEYDLMALRPDPKRSPERNTTFAPRHAPHPELHVVRPSPDEWRRLLPLQMAYEREEVLLPGREPNPAVSRSILTESLRSQRVLVAIFRDQIIGRVATNARGFNGDQIGGVYTDPMWRGKGVASWLMSHLLAELFREGRHASLFVKRSNPAALALYQHLEFETISDFQISYFL